MRDAYKPCLETTVPIVEGDRRGSFLGSHVDLTDKAQTLSYKMVSSKKEPCEVNYGKNDV
jgi:hypothetical protein